MKRFRKLAGFTIVELMMVVVILGIISVLGVPSFNNLIRNNRIVAMTNDLNSTLQLARAEAVRLGDTVYINAINESVANGLRVWIDKNNNSGFDDGEELRILYVESANLVISGDIGGTATKDLDFNFNARGESSLNNTLTLNICDNRKGNYGRAIELLVSGAVRLKTDVACGNE